MSTKALFSGLIVDEYDNPVETVQVGDESMYVVDDQGFRRHIPSEQVDRAVLSEMQSLVEGHEDLLSEQAAKMMGQEDPFTRAMLENQLKNMDEHFEQILKIGFPEDTRTYLGMTGFRIRINYHGEVMEVNQPGMIDPDNE